MCEHFLSVLQRLSVMAPWWSPLEAGLIKGDPIHPSGTISSLPFDSFDSTCIHEASRFESQAPFICAHGGPLVQQSDNTRAGRHMHLLE